MVLGYDDSNDDDDDNAASEPAISEEGGRYRQGRRAEPSERQRRQE